MIVQKEWSPNPILQERKQREGSQIPRGRKILSLNTQLRTGIQTQSPQEAECPDLTIYGWPKEGTGLPSGCISPPLDQGTHKVGIILGCQALDSPAILFHVPTHSASPHLIFLTWHSQLLTTFSHHPSLFIPSHKHTTLPSNPCSFSWYMLLIPFPSKKTFLCIIYFLLENSLNAFHSTDWTCITFPHIKNPRAGLHFSKMPKLHLQISARQGFKPTVLGM